MARAIEHAQQILVRQPDPAAANDDDLQVQRRVLLALAVMTTVAGILWGGLYWYFDEQLAAFIPWTYALLTTINVALFALLGRYAVFRFVQLSLILLLPFFLMTALGGLINSSAVIIWSLLAPLVALLVSGRRHAGQWFIAYLILIVAAGIMELLAPSPNNLPSLVLILFFVLNICIPTLFAFLLLVYFVGQKNSALRLLSLERAKSERLLLNVLPGQIAALLKEEDDRAIAEYCDNVSVLFADVVGFTPLSEALSPQEAVDVLNEIFSYFDALADVHGVEKIRTIGDGYMAASGVPTARPDHAHALARMALGMNAFMQSRSIQAGVPMSIRVGINSGSAVAGIVGVTKFHYDLWGDAVNVAARMESHGEPGKVQIGQATYELIQDAFDCEPRGPIAVKGKGVMETWFLLAERVPAEER